MHLKHIIPLSLSIIAFPLYAAARQRLEATQDFVVPLESEAPTKTSKARQQVEQLELENALTKAKQEKELAALQAEVQRLMLERERSRLREDLEQDKALKSYERELLQLRQQKEKLQAETELAKAKVDKEMEQFHLASVHLTNQVSLLQKEIERLEAEYLQHHAEKKRNAYIAGAPAYLKQPLQKDGSLVVSDRQIELTGIISEWKADYVIARIQYFNNKDSQHPIFIIINNSPGGSALAGLRILKTMEHSQAPVHVVVKSFAASMAACIVTLAEHSYAYPNAVMLHHQPWTFSTGGNTRAQKEAYEELQKWWERIGNRIAKKMGISLQTLDKKLYEQSARGDWSAFADEAKKLKWVNQVITGIKNTDICELPYADQYGAEHFYQEYYGVAASKAAIQGATVALPLLSPKDFYFLYNSDSRYHLHTTP